MCGCVLCVCVSVCLFVCVSVCLFVCVSVCVWGAFCLGGGVVAFGGSRLSAFSLQRMGSVASAFEGCYLACYRCCGLPVRIELNCFILSRRDRSCSEASEEGFKSTSGDCRSTCGEGRVCVCVWVCGFKVSSVVIRMPFTN